MTDVRSSLNHIVEAIDRITEYTARGFEDFARSQMIKDAVVRQMEIIGEAARRIRDETASPGRQPARENPLFVRQADIPWKQMIDFRQIASHEYEAVDSTLVWDAVTELPAIRRRVLAIRDREL